MWAWLFSSPENVSRYSDLTAYLLYIIIKTFIMHDSPIIACHFVHNHLGPFAFCNTMKVHILYTDACLSAGMNAKHDFLSGWRQPYASSSMTLPLPNWLFLAYKSYNRFDSNDRDYRKATTIASLALGLLWSTSGEPGFCVVRHNRLRFTHPPRRIQ